MTKKQRDENERVLASAAERRRAEAEARSLQHQKALEEAKAAIQAAALERRRQQEAAYRQMQREDQYRRGETPSETACRYLGQMGLTCYVFDTELQDFTTEPVKGIGWPTVFK